MPQDYNTQFSRSQAIASGSESGVVSTYVIPLGIARNFGKGKQVYVECKLEEALTNSDKTLDVDVVMDSTDSMNSLTEIKTIAAQFPALSAIGTRVYFPLPDVEPTSGDLYLGLRYYARAGAVGAGIVSAGLTLEPGRATVPARETTLIG